MVSFSQDSNINPNESSGKITALFNRVTCSIGKGLLMFLLLHYVITHRTELGLTFSYWYSPVVFIIICWLLGEIVTFSIAIVSKFD